MLDTLHDPHLVFDFLVENTIFYELPFVEFLGGVRQAIVLGGHLIHRGECAFPYGADTVVLLTTTPFTRHNALRAVRGYSVEYWLLRVLLVWWRHEINLCPVLARPAVDQVQPPLTTSPG